MKKNLAIIGVLSAVFATTQAGAEGWHGDTTTPICKASVTQADIEKRATEMAIVYFESVPVYFDNPVAKELGIASHKDYFRKTGQADKIRPITADGWSPTTLREDAVNFGIEAGQEMAVGHCSRYSGKSLQQAVETAVQNYLGSPKPN
jgi:hypothetical protein